MIIQQPQPDRQEILRALRAMYREGDVVELRALDVTTPRWSTPHTASGYFTDMEALADAAVEIGATAKAVYVVLNKIDPSLLGRSANRVKHGKVETTADGNIIARRFLLIDVDPERPSGVSSSEKEHAAALLKVQQVWDYLRSLGWPEPIVADSGNGGHLLYKIDLPKDDKGLVKRVLAGLAVRFDDELVQVDLTVHNPARISKLYGTVARKGDDLQGIEGVEDRSHRLARIISAPGTLEPVAREKLEAVALPVIKVPARAAQQSATTSFDLEQWIDEHNLDVRAPKNTQQGKVWVFNHCPWNEQSDDPHADDAAAHIIQLSNGAIAAGCHHERCKGKDWASLRRIYEPERKEGQKGNKNEPPTLSQGNATRSPLEPVERIKPQIMSARTLMQTMIEPTRAIVDGLLVEGVTLLAGKQKIGKSWFILVMALAVARGEKALGKLATDRGDVLYISLEDNPAAMQERLEVLLGKEDPPDNLYITHEWNPLPYGGMEDLDAWLDEHPNARLVVIDTLARVRPLQKPYSNAYYDDYTTIAPLKKIADQHKVALLLVHHFRKSESTDPYDAVSGSTGLTGAADATILLKRERANIDASLMLTGRKVREQELALQFSEECKWSLVGQAAGIRRTAFEHEALKVLAEQGPKTPSEYAKATGRNRDVVKQQLKRMWLKNIISANNDGRYYVPDVPGVPGVPGVPAHHTMGAGTQNTQPGTTGNTPPKTMFPASTGSTGQSIHSGNTGNAGNASLKGEVESVPEERESLSDGPGYQPHPGDDPEHSVASQGSPHPMNGLVKLTTEPIERPHHNNHAIGKPETLALQPEQIRGNIGRDSSAVPKRN